MITEYSEFAENRVFESKAGHCPQLAGLDARANVPRKVCQPAGDAAQMDHPMTGYQMKQGCCPR